MNAKLKRERILPHCATRHDRNLNAAINLRNLIMPVGRTRNGWDQEAVVQPRPWDSAKANGIVPPGDVDAALTPERRWRAPRGEAGITETGNQPE